MRKRFELNQGCMAKAFDHEPTFVLLARDIAAPAAIREWCRLRCLHGKNGAQDAQITEALAIADVMQDEQQLWHLEAKAALAPAAPPRCDVCGVTLEWEAGSTVSKCRHRIILPDSRTMPVEWQAAQPTADGRRPERPKHWASSDPEAHQQAHTDACAEADGQLVEHNHEVFRNLFETRKAVVCSCGFATTYSILMNDADELGMEHFERMHALRMRLESRNLVAQTANIGDLRRYLFVEFDCKWNGIVRDVTAEYEHDIEQVDVLKVYKRIVQIIRDNGQLDHSFPARLRLEELFDVPMELVAESNERGDGSCDECGAVPSIAIPTSLCDTCRHRLLETREGMVALPDVEKAIRDIWPRTWSHTPLAEFCDLVSARLQPLPAKQEKGESQMKELPFQTFERVTDHKWPGGKSSLVIAMLKLAGISAEPGTAEANLQLQSQLMGNQ